MRPLAQAVTDARIAVAWEECACLLCSAAHLTPLLEAPDPNTGLQFLVVRCNRCGLCFTNPRPDQDAIQQFYPSDYAGHQTTAHASRVDSMCKLLPMERPARLLDFGCGAGAFLQRMHARGWVVTGLDASSAAVARVRARGFSAHVGTLPHSLWNDPCFEAITMRQSLEHTHQPLEVLHAARRLLTAEGRLVLSVPNFDGVAAQWFGPDWYGLDLPRHLTHFTPTTLRAMLRRAGFERIQLRQESHRSWIRHSAELVQHRLGRKGSTRFLKSRVGSSIIGWWAALRGRAESIVAIALR